MKKMQIGTKKSYKVLVSRAALSQRDCAGKDYRGTIVRFTLKENRQKKKHKNRICRKVFLDLVYIVVYILHILQEKGR